MRRCYKLLLVFFCATVLMGCGETKEEVAEMSSIQVEQVVEGTESIVGVVIEAPKEETEESLEMEDSTESDELKVTEEILVEEVTEQKGYLIVIDAGHQQRGNSEKEPVGPGASETKAKVTGGTTGISTGLREYELNLKVALMLEEILLERGYEVLMVRNSHEVNLSNSERAAVANEAGADAFIRIHANGSENSGVNGAMTICQTPENPYNGALYEKSRKLSDCVLDAFVEKTGAKKQRVWETDTMSGINWASVPTTIIEMGYMSNPEEDQKMATAEYQRLMAEGIADGVERYFGQ